MFCGAWLGPRLGLPVFARSSAWTSMPASKSQYLCRPVGDPKHRRARLTFLEEDALQQRVLITKHQALVGCGAVCRLQVVQIGLVDADGLLELLDVLRPTFPECGLRLAIALLAFLRRCIDLLGSDQ